jgi:hypothetical protein
MDTDDPLPTETFEFDEKVIGDNPPSELISPDGSETTILLEGESKPSSGDWFENLAEKLAQNELDSLAEKYLDLIDEDREARKDRDKIQADGIKKCGIGEPAPGGAGFEGASKLTHPILSSSYIDFNAMAIKELFPPNGPVKTKIEGKPNKEKLDRAKRKSAFMNWQLMREIPSYRPELERLLTQLPVGGSQYMKLYWDKNKGAPDVEFVPIDDIVLPYDARNFFDVQRKFHQMTVSDFDYEQRVLAGEYLDLSLPAGYGNELEQTDSAKATDKIEGKKNDFATEEGNRLIYEGCIYYTITDDKAPKGRAVPYLITIDEESRKVLSLYRNWDEEDDKYREIDYLVDFTFIPWRGVFGLSLLQCLAGLPDALTGTLRALMDSALISNMQGGLKLKGNPGGASLSISPTQVTEVDAMGQDDIRKIYMPIPFNPPSPILFQLLGFLTQAAQGVVGTAEEKITDNSNQMPVGTTLALIEQGAKVFSSIHTRLHDSQRRCLEILHRLNRDHLPDGKVMYGTDPDDYVTREEFEGTMDVRPVSDPNIFSETQRFAQIQFVMQTLTQTAPVVPQVVQLFDLRALYARSFELAKIPDYAEFLPETPKAQPLNPVDENICLVMGKPVKAYAGQNHEAHIQVLLDFANNMMFGKSPVIAQKFLPGALNHLTDHMLVWYEEMMKADAAMQNGQTVQTVDWDNNPESSVMLAKSAAVVDKAAQLAFAQIPPLMIQAMQQLQAMQPKPPLDPMVQVETMKVQGQQQIEQGKLSLAQQKAQAEAAGRIQVLQAKLQEAQMDYNIAMQKIGTQAQVDTQNAWGQSQVDLQNAALDANTQIRTQNMQSQTDLAKTVHDNASAEEIARMKIASDEKTKLSTGASLE